MECTNFEPEFCEATPRSIDSIDILESYESLDQHRIFISPIGRDLPAFGTVRVLLTSLADVAEGEHLSLRLLIVSLILYFSQLLRRPLMKPVLFIAISVSETLRLFEETAAAILVISPTGTIVSHRAPKVSIVIEVNVRYVQFTDSLT